MKKRISITIDVDIAKKIEKLCVAEDRQTSNMINILLKQALNSREATEKDKISNES